MPSADSCAAIRSPCGSLSSRLGTRHRASPGKLGRLPRTPAGSTNLALMDMDFAIRCPLVRPSLPHIRFLFVRSRFCSTLPSDTTSRGCPCALLILHLHQVGWKTFTSQLPSMLGTQRGRGKPAPSVTEATKWFGPGLTSGAATARQCANGLFTPPAATSRPSRRRHKPPLLPRPSRSDAQVEA